MPTVTRIELSDGGIAPSAEYPWSVSGTVNVGDVVALSAAAPKTVLRADADNASARPPIGICIGRSGSLAQVALNGDVASGLSGLTRGSVYYLSTTAGALTATAPGSNIYPVGIATSATELLVDSSQADLAGGGGGGGGSVTSFGVTSSDFTVSNSPITTSGDVGLSLNTVGVAKGGTGLTSASEQGAMLYATSTSAYVAQAVNPTLKNRIINGGMTIAQRGTAAVSADGGYPVDRWRYFKTTAATASAQQSSDAPAGFSNSYGMTVTTGTTATAAQYAQMSQSIEGVNISDLGWGTASAKSIVLSFWVKSSLAGTYCVSIRNSEADRTYVAPYTVSGAGWQRKTLTIPGDTSGTWLVGAGIGIRLLWDWGSGSNYATPTASAWVSGNFAFATGNQANLIGTTGATFYLTGVQLEAGSVATEFELRPQQVELALCQRYFARMTGTLAHVGAGTSTTNLNALFFIKYPQAMRSTPTMSASVRISEPGVNVRTAIAGTINYGSDSASANFASSSLTLGRALLLQTETANTNYLDFSAEL
jgi:hypothetical protein